MEPICAEVFPGNSSDPSSYPAFIRDNDIRKGIIVADKGLPPSKIKDELAERPELHFLTPIKRNDVRIADNDMLSFEGVLQGIDAHVVYKKKQIKGGRFLYAYRDTRKASIEEADYLAKAADKKNFNPQKYDKKSSLFGVIVLSPIRIWIQEPHTCAMMTAGFWNWYLIVTRTMNVWIRPMSRETSR